MDKNELEKLYGRLKGINDVCSRYRTIERSLIEDYNSIVQKIGGILNEDLIDFIVVYEIDTTWGKYSPSVIHSKLLQFLSYLEYGYKISENVLEIGTIYNSIDDEELSNRCSDILSAHSNFDRVINQATLVLENRIRNKAKADRRLVGVELVNKILNTDINKAFLKISEDPSEHEGICHICRGMMMSYRNPTHHTLTDYSREEALKVTAFIDTLLKIIDEGVLV